MEDILDTLEAKFEEEKDLRVLARDNLTNHALVKRIDISEADLTFHLKSGWRGQVNTRGGLYMADPHSNDDDWTDYKRIKAHNRAEAERRRRAAPDWKPAAGGDLDDDIPF